MFALILITTTAACVAEDYALARPMPKPESGNPLVVVLGSSTAAGVGASHPPEAWAAGLEKKLAQRGLKLINRSIPGTATAESLARFAVDVTPHRPAFVLLTTSLLNENFLAAPFPALERYRQNTIGLIERVRRIGAVPALMTMYPNVRFGRVELDAIEQWTAFAESMGWPLFNFMSSVSEPDGSWIGGSAPDGIHPAAEGHRQMLDAIPESMFSAILASEKPTADLGSDGSWQAPGWGDEPVSLEVELAGEMESHTVAAYVLDPAVSESVTYLQSNGSTALRLARRFDRLEIQAGEEVLWSRSAPGFGWRHIAFGYQSLTGRITVSIDGARWGEAWASAGLRFRSVQAAEGCLGCGIAHLLVYRSYLHPGEASSLAGRRVLNRSLEFGAALNTAPANGIQGFAPTFSELHLNGAWRLDRESFPSRCAPLYEGDPSIGVRKERP